MVKYANVDRKPLYRDEIGNKLLPTLRLTSKLFTCLHDTVAGTMLQLLATTASGSILTPYGYNRRVKEATVINRYVMLYSVH